MCHCLSILISCLALTSETAPGVDADASTEASADVVRLENATVPDATYADTEPIAPVLGRCKGVKSIKGMCREDGTVRSVVKFRKDTWDGRVVTFAVGERLRVDVAVDGNKAILWTCCFDGPSEVELLEPEGCLDPIEVTCPE